MLRSPLRRFPLRIGENGEETLWVDREALGLIVQGLSLAISLIYLWLEVGKRKKKKKPRQIRE
jgi:hypothetical protein